MSLMAAEPLSLATCPHDPGLDPHHVPEGTGELDPALEYDKIEDVVQISAVLLEPDGTFRRHVWRPGGPGPRRLVTRAGASDATPGARRPPARRSG
ncbi:hypothetical protein [Nonomuraea dietziae]|uniref:hypothetical protein n=1 Tax=Nonomuraea dietziae TaxID=65515 RepID=UPI003423493F